VQTEQTESFWKRKGEDEEEDEEDEEEENFENDRQNDQDLYPQNEQDGLTPTFETTNHQILDTIN